MTAEPKIRSRASGARLRFAAPTRAVAADRASSPTRCCRPTSTKRPAATNRRASSRRAWRWKRRESAQRPPAGARNCRAPMSLAPIPSSASAAASCPNAKPRRGRFLPAPAVRPRASRLYRRDRDRSVRARALAAGRDAAAFQAPVGQGNRPPISPRANGAARRAATPSRA